MTSVLLVAPMPISAQRAGPANRFWEFAHILSAEHRVTVLVPNDDHPSPADFAVRTGTDQDLESLLTTTSVVIVQGPALQRHPQLTQLLVDGNHYLVADLYDPITLEQLEIDRGGQAGRWLQREYGALLNEQLRLADFFLCASERQRHYWLGALAALGRLNPDTYDGSDLRRLIDVVPFGLPTDPPQPANPVLKGVWPGIGAEDRVIVWGGGLWDWLDPLTPIRAMAQVAAHQPTARLVFFEAECYGSAMLGRAKTLAAELGLLGRHILFADWLSPEKWAACLLEADVGLSFHPATIETRLAFRTRLLDYLWAGLPIVAARGDVLSDLVAAQGLGQVVEPGNVQALAAALTALLVEPDARTRRAEAFQQAAAQYRWERVTRPLQLFCRQPWHAGDWERRSSEQWQAATRDQAAAQAAYAQRRLAEAEYQLQQQAGQAQAQIDDLTRRLEQCEFQLEAAMSGRVMRWMTGVQRAVGAKPAQRGES